MHLMEKLFLFLDFFERSYQVISLKIFSSVFFIKKEKDIDSFGETL